MLMSRSSLSSSYVTMISHFNIFVKTFLITNMTFISFLKAFFVLVISKGLLKFSSLVFLHDSAAISIFTMKL